MRDMKESLTTPGSQVRCRTCNRLLCVMQPDALAGWLTIRCPRCKADTTLRPSRAPDRARPERPTEKGPGDGLPPAPS